MSQTVIWIIALVIVLIFKTDFFRRVPKNHKGVVYRLGRIIGMPRDSGFVLNIPFIDEMKIVSMLPAGLNIKNNKLDVHITYRVDDPKKALTMMSDYHQFMSQLSKHEIDKKSAALDDNFGILEMNPLADELKKSLNTTSNERGVVVDSVEVKKS